MKKKISKFLIFLLAIEALFSYMPDTTAYAKTTGHSSAVIQPGIDESGRYSINVIQDDNNWGLGLEAGGMGADVSTGLNYMAVLGNGSGNYSSIKFTKDTNFVDLGYASDEKGSAKGDYKLGASSNALFFSFPSHNSSAFFDNDYDSNDYMRAQSVAETLGKNLNNLIDYFDALDGVRDLTADTLGDATYALSAGLLSPNTNPTNGFQEININVNGKDYYIYYGYMSGKVEGLHYSKNDTGDVFLHAYVSRDNTPPTVDTIKDYQKITWAELKGYLAPCGAAASEECRAKGDTGWCNHNPSDYLPGQAYVKANCSSTEIASSSSTTWADSSDTTWITIWDIANYANYYYYAAKTNSDTLANSEKPGLVESTISNILLKLLGNIRSMLQLKSVTELVYQSNSNEITGGVMDFNWWAIMLKYHLIFQVLAWLIVGLALAKMILELNLSTINPNQRVGIIQQLEKLFIVGFLLALVVPIMRAMIEVNSVLVEVFSTQAPNNDEMLFSAGGIAGIVIAFFYLGIVIMLNCTYIMRGIMIAIFGASAPLFIVTMMFSKGKGMFDNWLKEMAANIFLQSIHAFSFAFLSSVIKSGNWLAQLVVVYSLMPITEQFRSFIFGSSGGFTTAQGGKAAQAIHDTGVGAAKAVTHATGTAANGIYSVAAKGVKADMENGGAKDSSSGGASGGRAGAGGAGGTGLTDTMKAHARNISDRKDAKMGAKVLGGAVKGAAMAMNGMSGIASAATQMTSGAMQIQQGNIGEGVRNMNASMMTAGNTVGSGIANTSSDIARSMKQREERMSQGSFSESAGMDITDENGKVVDRASTDGTYTYTNAFGHTKTKHGGKAVALAAKYGKIDPKVAAQRQASSHNSRGETLSDVSSSYDARSGTATMAVKGQQERVAAFNVSRDAWAADTYQSIKQGLVDKGSNEIDAANQAYEYMYDGNGNVLSEREAEFNALAKRSEGVSAGGRRVYGDGNGEVHAMTAKTQEIITSPSSKITTANANQVNSNFSRETKEKVDSVMASHRNATAKVNEKNGSLSKADQNQVITKVMQKM